MDGLNRVLETIFHYQAGHATISWIEIPKDGLATWQKHAKMKRLFMGRNDISTWWLMVLNN